MNVVKGILALAAIILGIAGLIALYGVTTAQALSLPEMGLVLLGGSVALVSTLSGFRYINN